MCAALWGSKRSYSFEDIPSPASSKRHRCGSAASLTVLTRLQSLYPHLEPQVLERTFEKCGNDVDSTIANLNVQPLENDSGSAEDANVNVQQDSADVGNGVNIPTPINVPASGAEWVDFFVRELMSVTSIDDAKARTSILLETLEKPIRTNTGEELAQHCNEEIAVLKQQVGMLSQENGILKRAVNIQHERLKDYITIRARGCSTSSSWCFNIKSK